MPLPSVSLNPFPDRKKPAPTDGDDLAAVKAAAWAWFHHGSGSEAKPMREFGLTRTTILPKPSRYRLHAITTLIQDNSQTPNPHNSLLDAYEIQSISRRLSDLLDPADRNNFSLRSFDSEILDPEPQVESKKKTKHKKLRGFWRRPSVMCGKTEDVDVGSSVRRPTRRRSPAHD